MEAKGCIIPDVNNANKTWKMRRRGAWGIKDNNHGGKMVLILAEDDNGVISKKKLPKCAHGAKEMQLELSRQLFYCDDVKVGLDKAALSQKSRM